MEKKCSRDKASRDAERLEHELKRISESAASVVGAVFHHVESGRKASLNGDLLFPMASTLKIPLAVHILSLVDEGTLSLDQVITLKASDIFKPTWGPIGTFFNAGTVLTLRDLLTLMLMDSDNNATDVLYRIGGGTSAVKRRMRSYGFEQINNDRPTNVLLANLYGRSDSTEATPLSPDEFKHVVPDLLSGDWGTWRGEQARARLRQHESSDTRDTTTPASMAALLNRIWARETLKADSTKLLIDIMTRCITGARRLKGMLPPGSFVAHKTGTLQFATSDVGIIELPHGAGHLVAVVYLKDSFDTAETRELQIAHLARAAFDFFTFTVRPDRGCA